MSQYIFALGKIFYIAITNLFSKTLSCYLTAWPDNSSISLGVGTVDFSGSWKGRGNGGGEPEEFVYIGITSRWWS